MECEKTLVGVRLRKLSIDTLVELDRARRMYHSYKTKRIPYFASIFVALEVWNQQACGKYNSFSTRFFSCWSWYSCVLFWNHAVGRMANTKKDTNVSAKSQRHSFPVLQFRIGTICFLCMSFPPRTFNFLQLIKLLSSTGRIRMLFYIIPHSTASLAICFSCVFTKYSNIVLTTCNKSFRMWHCFEWAHIFKKHEVSNEIQVS